MAHTPQAASKPELFIGSSTKGLSIAEEVQRQLGDVVEITLWPKLFPPGENFFQTLMIHNLKFDFAVLVFTPDDDIITREQTKKSARDNVIFELGLAFGRLGARRSFVVIEEKVNIPSDLAGLQLLKFNASDDADAVKLAGVIKPCCDRLRDIMLKQFKEPELGLLPSTALAIGYFKNFLQKVCDALFDEVKEIKLENKQDGKTWKNDQNFNINVIIPEALAYLGPKQIQHKLKENALTGISITAKSRPYPLYIKADVSDNKTLQLYDLPTTLFSSIECIERVVPNNILDHEALENLLQVRELRNFRKTLDHLLNKKENEPYSNCITIDYRGN